MKQVIQHLLSFTPTRVVLALTLFVLFLLTVILMTGYHNATKRSHSVNRSVRSRAEGQHIKLASELHMKGSIYVMDEPTTGLHMSDIDHLLEIMNRLVDADNTMIVIEHNLEVISQADWIIDMGLDGQQGSAGGVRGHAFADRPCGQTEDACRRFRLTAWTIRCHLLRR